MSRMNAKYSGKCKKCGRTILVGDEIEWIKGTGTFHAVCYENTPRSTTKTATVTTKTTENGASTGSGGFPSKYAGTCTTCGGKISIGDMIHYNKETKATHAKCPEFVPPELPDTDDAIVSLYFREGEYLSAYIPSTCRESLEKLGVAHYVSGWGTKIDDDIVKALGEQFTIKQIKDLAIPRLEAAFNKKRAIELEKQKKRNDAFDQARSTGQQVVLRQWSEECDGSTDECDIDTVTIYAMPDGTTKTSRSHSY